jgi:transposase-like protein
MTTNPRKEDGRKIAEQPDQIKRVSDNWYQVKAQSLKFESWYDVVFTEMGLVCDCPDFQWRNIKCKHCYAVEFSQLLRREVWNQTRIHELSQINCRFCNSQNIRKNGSRKNKNYDLQRYFCNDCKKFFSFNIGFEKMRASPQMITSAMQLYFSGESLRNVQKFLKLQGLEISHIAVYKWIKKYVHLMETYLENIKPKVSDVWRADELYVRIKGNPKYIYALMDDETRFWIAKQVSDTKYTADIQPMFHQAKLTTQKRPLLFITDGAQNFMKAYRKEFWRDRDMQTKHMRHIHLAGDHNNNKMERMNGEIRDREKVMRGLKNGHTPIIEGYRIYHNFIRPHMGLEGKTPAEVAGIKVGGENKWITIIQNASNQPRVNRRMRSH